MSFVDHLQLLPMPHAGGKRQPDGAHRPGGLGTRTIADRLEERGWIARIEDIGYDKPLAEPLLAEAYARGLGDGVASSWDRNRFPILLLRSGYGALGVVDALGAGTRVVWVDARGSYAHKGRFRRRALESSALALVTGRAARDRRAVRPVQLDAERIVLVGGGRADRGEREALAHDGVRLAGVEDLPGVVAGLEADAWYLHVDVGALRRDSVPAADDARDEGLDPGSLARVIGDAFRGRPLKALALARYDLNRDQDGRALVTIVELIEAAVVAAGGVPSPGARSSTR